MSVYPSTWDRPSAHDVATTLDRLESAVAEFGGIEVIARVDQAAIVARAGVSIAPAQMLILENPMLVAQLASHDIELLIDLPIRVLAWEGPHGTRVRTMDPALLGAGTEDPSVQEVRHAITTILGGWLDSAAGPLPTASPSEGTAP